MGEGGKVLNFWEIEMEEVQDSEEAKEDEIIVEEDECPITNIFEVLHNPTFVEADNNDNVCM